MNRELFRRILEFVGRHRFNSACVVIMLVAIGVAAWYLKDFSALQSEYDAVSAEGQGGLDLRYSAPTLREEFNFVSDAVRRVDENLFDEFNRPENYEYFREIALRSRAALADLQQLTSAAPARGSYKSVPFDIRVTGTYEQLHTFLYGVETGPRLSNVVSFSIRRIPNSESDLTLEMRVELLARS